MSPAGPSSRGPVVVLLLAWLIISGPIWAMGETHYLRDFWTNYVPARQFLHDALVNGTSPLWTPWVGGGLPIIPDPGNSALYLPGWPTFLFPDQPWVLSLFVSVHLLLGACGTFKLVRRTVGPWGAAAAGLSFGLGGLLVGNQINAQWEYSACWTPWWFWAFFRALDDSATARDRVRYTLLLSLFWALQLLAPDPQTAYLEGLAGGLATIAKLTRHWRPLALFAGAALLASLIAAPQVLAFLEALGQTQRAGFSDDEAAQWSLSAWRAWELVLPLPFGRLTPETTFWATPLVAGQWRNFYFVSLYSGAATLAFGLAGAGTLGRRHALWVGGAFFLLAAALGTTLPLYTFLKHHLPLWAGFRYPERLVLLSALGVAVLVGRGVDRLARAQDARLLWLFLAPMAASLVAWLWPSAVGADAGNEAAVTVVRASAQQALGLCLASVLCAGGVRQANGRGLALTLVLAVDLLIAGFAAQSTWTPPEPKPVPWSASGRALVSLADVTAATEQLPPTPALRRQFEDWAGRPNLNSARLARTTNAVTSLALTRSALARQHLGLEGAAALFETEVVLTRAGTQLATFTPRERLPGGLVLQHALAPPSAIRCSSAWACVENVEDAARVLALGRFPVEDCGVATAHAGAEVACTVARPSPGVLEATLSPTSTPSAVSVSESWYPGWQVRFDRGPWTAAVPTRLALVGAIAPVGARLAEFRFRPAWLLPSVLLSAVCCLGLLFGLFKLRPASR
jgi:hypothetical protein